MTTDSVLTPPVHEAAEPDLGDSSDSAVVEALGPAIQLKSQLSKDSNSLEHEHLTRQLKSLAQEVKRVRSQAAATRALGRDVIEPETWSPKQLNLARMAVGRWRKMRTFKMAEQILVSAVEVREANVIASVYRSSSTFDRDS